MQRLLTALFFSAVTCNAKSKFDTIMNSDKLAEDGSSLLQFRIEQTNDQNQTWTCLRLEFTMKSNLNLNGKTVSNVMTNSTVPASVSNCSTLQLNLVGDAETNTVTLNFLEQTTEHGTSTIFLTSIYGRALTFQTSNRTLAGEARANFVPEGSLPTNTSFVTPVEVNGQDSSFRCYNGFSTAPLTNIAQNAIENSTVSFEFRQFRLERYPEYTTKAAELKDDSPWQRILSCDEDISTVLPILVGCVLAGIVLITLVGYVIARRRSQHAYEEL